VDWKRVRATTDREIATQIASDPDTAPDMAKAGDMRRVYNPPLPDIKAIRQKLGLSQSAFANRFGFSVRTVQQWEQGRSVPDRPQSSKHCHHKAVEWKSASRHAFEETPAAPLNSSRKAIPSLSLFDWPPSLVST
jgi:DNA-binding transcriptional regulator YiaG